MTPIGAAGSGSVNPFSALNSAKGKVSAKTWNASSQAASSKPTSLADLQIPRINSFEQKIEEDGLPTTVLYDAFGRFRKAILPKGKIIDLYL